jgi:cytochrome c oxidase cbb3-type subunit 3
MLESLLLAIISVLIVATIPILAMAIQLYNAVANRNSMQQEAYSYNEEPSFWEMLGDLKPLSKEKELLLEEDFDGIKELNNPVPTWFNVLFYGTIGFGLVYLLIYHSWNMAPLQDSEYEQEVRIANVEKAERNAKNPAEVIDENNVALSNDAAILGSGKNVFMSYCAACHGKQGEGNIGPNLSDTYWLHGGTIQSVFKSVKYGIPDKGMVAWDGQLTSAQIRDVSNYILSLQGTNPPNAKAPQGELVTK